MGYSLYQLNSYIDYIITFFIIKDTTHMDYYVLLLFLKILELKYNNYSL